MGKGANFEEIGAAALLRLPLLCKEWLPDGRQQGCEWVALNPRRNDSHLGSFKVNLRTGRWADFATGDRLSERRAQGTPALRIPYRDPSGAEPTTRFRTALEKCDREDNRFCWKIRSKPLLYGLWRLRAGSSIVVAEGESDCHTLWYHGINAVGLPGASNWNETRDAQHLAGFETIYVIVEPDKGGEATLRWASKSSLRDRIRLVRLDRFKDPSAMHVADPERFQERW